MMGNVKIPVNTWNSVAKVAKRIGGLLGSWEYAAGEVVLLQSMEYLELLELPTRQMVDALRELTDAILRYMRGVDSC
jgi:hypothetical protein